MCKQRLFQIALTLGFSMSLALPVMAQSANDTAKKLGQRGMYGARSTNPDGTPVEGGDIEEMPQEEKLTEEQKRLRAKYPVTRSSRTQINEDAHVHLLEGIQRYYKVRKMFEEIKNINGKFEAENHILTIEQKGVIEARIQPEDLLKYGPENAHIGIRIRALEDAVLLTEDAIKHFSAAQQLAPTVVITNRWLRIAQDTRKALRFHIAYYKRAYEAAQLGATAAQLEFMAKMWKTQFDIKPQDSLTFTVPTMLFEMERRRSGLEPKKATDGDSEKKDFSKFIQNLPTLDFKVDK